jgi:hypothetical protein
LRTRLFAGGDVVASSGRSKLGCSGSFGGLRAFDGRRDGGCVTTGSRSSSPLCVTGSFSDAAAYTRPFATKLLFYFADE